MDFGPLVPANNPIVRELQPAQALSRAGSRGRTFILELPPHDSAVGEYFRVLIKRKWVVLTCLLTIFSRRRHCHPEHDPVYEASGTIAINKPDASLEFSKLGNLQPRLLRPHRTRDRSQDSAERSAGAASHPGTESGPAARIRGIRLRRPGSLDLAPDPLQSDPAQASAMLAGFKGNLQVALSPNTRIIEVHYRSADPRSRRTSSTR